MSAHQAPPHPPHRFHPHDPDAAPPPTPFAPLFTLISTSSNNPSVQPDHHHPTVHYIFTSDPDPLDATTRAALASLHPPSSPSSPNPSPNETKPEPSKNERFLILDLDPTGTKVVNAASLSPDWQITGAEIGPAPTWEGGEGEGEGEARLMLRVEGCEGTKPEAGIGDGKEGEGMDVEALVAGFERRMGELRRVVEAREKMGKAAGVGGEIVGKRDGLATGDGLNVGDDFGKDWV